MLKAIYVRDSDKKKKKDGLLKKDSYLTCIASQTNQIFFW